ncbi:hypothetical protein KP509_24G063600 [Ceratopteris richardii]|uniref:Uncharacterized protein n=1 Tax=Ceratopteris richardii TaxID=49495 RepID=A0A8T2RVQ2_CERRI|nr:hypothetical protein KP509_24G063600 [Ceratopteris richardii]KAH7300463.1 hypothetical protein KP509_24G063600 [Ceratopteris richardii]
MKSCVPIYHSAYSPPPLCLQSLSSSRISHHSFLHLLSLKQVKQSRCLWLRVQARSLKLIQHTVCFQNFSGPPAVNHKGQWHAPRASQVEFHIFGIPERGELPVAVSAMVGSIIARRKLILIILLFSITVVVALTSIVPPGLVVDKITDVFPEHGISSFIVTIKSIIYRVILYLGGLWMTSMGSSSAYFHNVLVSVGSFLTIKRVNNRHLLSLNQESSIKAAKVDESLDTVINNIQSCIANVEDMLLAEKDLHNDAQLSKLKKRLSLLNSKVALLSKGNQYGAASTSVRMTLDPAIKPHVKKPKSRTRMKSIKEDLHQLEVKESNRVQDEDFSVKKSSVTSKLDENYQVSGELHFLKESNDELSMPGNEASETVLDPEFSLPLKEAHGLDVLGPDSCGTATNGKTSEQQKHSFPRSKYIDYWLEHDECGSIILSNVDHTTHKQVNMDYSSHLYNSAPQTYQNTQRKGDFKPSSPESAKESVSIGVHASNVDSEAKSRGIVNFHDNCIRINNVGTLQSHVGNVSHRSAFRGSETTNHYAKEVEKISVGIDGDLDESSKQFMVNSSVKGGSGLEQEVAFLGSTKELAFVQEDADLHVLTGSYNRVNDMEFQKAMNDGEIALKHGKTGLCGKIEVGDAERMLYKAADCFASAATLDPSSVQAIGCWGNSLLVHGELKLRLSRELRHLISTPDVISPYWIRQSKAVDAGERSNHLFLQKQFQAVCEECEELLIQAGRKYRKVLSRSNSEVRALYNWGLALCFRAQLIAEGGQNAIEAADKIYLAAIDKFEAMMGINRRYAPGAMLNWGFALKERSRLRPANSTERISLLQQAKQLFMDALRLQPDDAKIQSAFVTCNLELKELNERQEISSKSEKSFFRKRRSK